jgi:hypothetical protein
MRWVTIFGAIGVLAHSAFEISRTGSADGALSALLALMALGTTLARLRQAPGIAVAAGVVAAGTAVLALIRGSEPPVLAIAYLGVSLALLLAGFRLLRPASAP